MKFFKRKEITTTQIILSGFLGAIIIGALLLMLPIASSDNTATPFVDALFTATTSICVTGLTTVNTLEHWSLFGKIIITILIQFGGLGVVTFTTTVLLILRKRITLKERLLIQDAYNLDTLKGLVKLTIRIIKGTFLVEGIGALLYCIKFIPEFGFWSGIGRAVFNSVSAFCNAGMDVLGQSSLEPYQSSILINFTTMGLIILGGIGFPVWWDVLHNLKENVHKTFKPRLFWRKLNLHTKIAITMTIFLIASGTIIILILEYSNPNTMGSLSFGQKGMAALFQSVTTRTAGFFTIPQENFTNASAFLCLILMFIGGSPSGTAGGVKTVTIAIIVFAVISAVKEKPDVEAFHRKVFDSVLRKALAVIMINLAVLITSTMLLSIVENASFLDVIYETTSALATVGLSRGLTPELSTIGKYIVICTMYLGRVGPLAMALAFNYKSVKTNARSLPAESVRVG